MIPAEAFIAIEGLLGKHLQNAFSKVAGDLLREVSALLDSGDYSGATEKAQGLTLEPMFEESKAFIEKQTNMAMLFGASRVSNTPGTSVVGLGFEKTMTAQIVETFRGHFRNAETYLRDKAVQLIAQTRDEKEPVQKANPYHDERGRFSTKDKARFISTSEKFAIRKEKKLQEVVQSLKSYAEDSIGTLKERVVILDRGNNTILEDVTQELYLTEDFTHRPKEGSGYTTLDIGTDKEGRPVPDGSLTHLHTHPMDHSFSDGDWRVFSRSPIGEMVVVSPNAVYKLTKTPEWNNLKWQERTPNAITAAYNEVLEEAFQLYVSDPEYQGDKFVPKVVLEASKLMAKKFGVKFSMSGEEVVLKAEKRILLDFKSFMDGEGNAQMNLISSLHTSRVSAYGFTAEANVLGLDEYQINEQLDNRICPVCRTMHGKRFKVTDARKLLEVVLRTQDPDQLKSLQPWPKQTKEAVAEMASLTPEEMVARGWHIPPFHPGCRGLLVRVGKAPPSPGTPTVERLPEVIKSDFDVLGVQATPVQVKSWAKNFPVKPEEVISAVTGTPVPDVLAKAVVEGISPLGVTDFKVKRGSVSVIAEIPTGGKEASTQPKTRVELSALFSEKTIQLASSSLKAGLTPTTKKMVNSAYLLTKDAEYQKLAMRVEGAGAYQWARMGFQISDEDWAKLIILLRIAYHEIKKELSEEARHEVEKLLATSSGASIISLSQLGVDQSGIHVGKAMMAGISYDGYLDVTSPVSMEAFLSGLSS